MHIRQFVRDTLMTIDTSFTCTDAFVVCLNCTAALFGKVHELEVVTVSTFTRIGGFHRTPYIAGQFQTFGFKFLTGVDGAECFMQQLIACLYLRTTLETKYISK